MRNVDSYYDIEPKNGCLGEIIGGLIGIITCIVISLCVTSCRTTRTTIDTDSVYISKTELASIKDSVANYKQQLHTISTNTNTRDSVYNYHKDSTFVFIKGDSTIIEHWHENTIYKEYEASYNVVDILRDSLSNYTKSLDAYYSKLDSIANSSHYEETTKMVKYTPWYIKILSTIGVISIIVLLLFILYKVRLG